MNEIQLCRKLRDMHNELRDMANIIEKETVETVNKFSAGLTLRGYTVNELVKFIEFGLDGGYDPRKEEK